MKAPATLTPEPPVVLAEKTPAVLAEKAPVVEFSNVRLDPLGALGRPDLTFTSTGSRLVFLGNWSAFFAILLGRAELTSGAIRLHGLPISEALASGRVAVISPKAPLPGSMKVHTLFVESTRLAGFSHSLADSRATQVLTELNLAALGFRRIDSLSELERRAMWVAHALLTWPELVLVEDLFCGVADYEKEYLWGLARAALAGRKWGVWVQGDDPASVDGAVLRESDEVLAIEQGRLLQGAAARAQANPTPTTFRVVVGQNAPQFFAELGAMGLSAHPMNSAPQLGPEGSLVGTAGRGIVELPGAEARRQLFATSVTLSAPILELVPITHGPAYFEPTP
ncbi:MAG: hypothetical protein SFV15_14895 [Polyangiaceae bacterium]|nr:hypothetical protein [Polyangiaceae bacterium]